MISTAKYLSLTHGTFPSTGKAAATLCPKCYPSWFTYPNPFCPRQNSKNSTFVMYTFKSSLFLTLQPAQAERLTVTSGEDTGHPENPPSNGPTKSGHPLRAGQSGARLSTYYSQTQPGPPEFSQHIASTVGSPTRHTTNYGPPILIPPPPCSTPNLQGEAPI